VNQSNSNAEDLAVSIYSVLEKSTSERLERNPNAWWDWWQSHNGRYLPRKPLHDKQYQHVDRARTALVVTDIVNVGHECLVKGTLVQTAQGLKPIESLKIGDCVVSQDVESGEVALKPILQTTVRPPEAILKIVTAEGEIQATGGHRWFVSGKGWLMSKELQQGLQLHTSTGTSTIVRVDSNQAPQESFNLVVDQFHTYFVGKNRVLSYDNTELKPTLRAVPGYGQIAVRQSRKF
jgi:Pretoxin HINT domain